MKVNVTGIKPTGTPHLGNYIGAIRPALRQSQANHDGNYFFIADYHALTSIHNASELQRYVHEVAATWLACGLDPAKITFYRQSQVPQILELSWILTCMTPKGLMNRAHAYKAAAADNLARGAEEEDININMGLYCYPILMAADILSFDATEVPVGPDQLQHIEITRELARRINHLTEQELLVVPAYKMKEDIPEIPGLDGRKMSKSYDNYVPLFVEGKKLRKLIFKYKTDSSGINDPKDPEACALFMLYKLFAAPDKVAALRTQYQTGIGWGAVKELVFEEINHILMIPRQRYLEYMQDWTQVEAILKSGEERARQKAQSVLTRVKEAFGY